MALKEVYERFLASPNATHLSEQFESYDYIPTAQSFQEPSKAIRHLELHNKNEWRKRGEDIISVVEGPNSLCIDLVTTLELIAGGGYYLPGLDNFITGKTVTFPQIHIVTFDRAQKIRRVRIHWDQGSLLRQVSVIGQSGRNWPITDGKDQARMIASKHTEAARGRDAETAPPAQRNVSPSKKRIQDPHTSLNLFSGEQRDEGRVPHKGAIAPRASAKPGARDMGDLFAAGNVEFEDSKDGTPSPKKPKPQQVIAPKAGGASKFAPSRLFSDEPSASDPAKYKSHPLKYNHFDMGETPEEKPFQRAESKGENVPLRPKTNKHQSQWDFADFATPEKSRNRVRGQDVRHFGFTDGPENVDPHPTKARPDSQPHFEFKDDGTPDSNHQRRPKANVSNEGQGLYKNNVYDEDADVSEPSKQPLANVTNNVARSKDFGQHWDMADEAPADKGNNENRPLANDRQQAVKMMDSQWESYDQSPEPKQAAASKPGRKGMESHWGFEDEDKDKPQTAAAKKGAKGGKGGFWDF